MQGAALVPYFMAGLVILCLLVLVSLQRSVKARLWYGVVLLSFFVWLKLYLFVQTASVGLYVLPLLWFIGTCILGFPANRFPDFPNQPKESLLTQESLQGANGTRSVLTLYFTLLFLLAIAILLLFQGVSFYR
jgi:hypothetical protein